MRNIVTIFFLVLTAGAAGADTAAANACKAKLSPTGQEIYTASLAQNPTMTTGREIIKTEVEKLIGEGKVSLSEGRKDGEAVGKCLELLN